MMSFYNATFVLTILFIIFKIIEFSTNSFLVTIQENLSGNLVNRDVNLL